MMPPRSRCRLSGLDVEIWNFHTFQFTELNRFGNKGRRSR